MAWTAPRTWVTSEVVTASLMNTHVRDNLLETAPAKASGSGGIFVSTGTNAIALRGPSDAEVSTAQTTASTSYTDLATSGPAITATTGTEALLLIGCAMSQNTANARNFMSITVSGATADSAADGKSYNHTPATASEFHEACHFVYYDALTAGSNTFTAKYRVDAGTGTFARRRMWILPL